MKVNKILIILVIVLFLALVGLIVGQKFLGKPDFYAVFLRNGNLYFGKLVRFPSFGLKQVYFLQIDQQNTQNPLSIQRFKNVFWGPEDYLRINKDEVVWITKLDPRGQLYQLITTNPDLIPQAPPQLPPQSQLPPPLPNQQATSSR